jgi:hypothetical protein
MLLLIEIPPLSGSFVSAMIAYADAEAKVHGLAGIISLPSTDSGY